MPQFGLSGPSASVRCRADGAAIVATRRGLYTAADEIPGWKVAYRLCVTRDADPDYVHVALTICLRAWYTHWHGQRPDDVEPAAKQWRQDTRTAVPKADRTPETDVDNIRVKGEQQASMCLDCIVL